MQALFRTDVHHAVLRVCLAETLLAALPIKARIHLAVWMVATPHSRRVILRWNSRGSPGLIPTTGRTVSFGVRKPEIYQGSEDDGCQNVK